MHESDEEDDKTIVPISLTLYTTDRDTYTPSKNEPGTAPAKLTHTEPAAIDGCSTFTIMHDTMYATPGSLGPVTKLNLMTAVGVVQVNARRGIAQMYLIGRDEHQHDKTTVIAYMDEQAYFVEPLHTSRTT